MKTVTKVCFAVLASLLMVPLVACGGGGAPTTPPPTPPPAAGLKIISLTPEPLTLIPNMETKITCNVSNPDGGKLTYTWTAPAGTITGTLNNIAVWQAPNFVGEFTVTVTVSDGKGGTAAQSLTLSVLANRPPVISSLTAVPARLQRGETSTITCLASDPDGDVLTATSYTWTISGGTLTGAGNRVTWKAPDSLGTFTVSVTVDDGKGGTANSSCSIVVATPELTLILTPILTPLAESGSVDFSGVTYTSFMIGDNAKDYGVRPYFSFDITGLVGATIKQATLTFTRQQTFGNPFSTPIGPYLYVDSVDYGARALRGGDFSLPTFSAITTLMGTPPSEVNALESLNLALQTLKSRFQVRLRFGQPPEANCSNLNRNDDYIIFSKVELTIVYSK